MVRSLTDLRFDQAVVNDVRSKHGPQDNTEVHRRPNEQTKEDVGADSESNPRLELATVWLGLNYVEIWKVAPRAGLEPATLRLTAGCSAIELPRNAVARLWNRRQTAEPSDRSEKPPFHATAASEA
jgi:hypothetical protein